MNTDLLFGFLCIVVILISVFGYQYGKSIGQQRAKYELVRETRKIVHENIIIPWEKEFKKNFSTRSTNEHKSDCDKINFCFLLARKLYSIRWISPNVQDFKIAGLNSVDFICSGTDSERYPVNIDLGLHPGSPLEYVDAMLYISIKNKRLPCEIWLNVETREITDSPEEGNKYEHIFLKVDDSSNNQFWCENVNKIIS